MTPHPASTNTVRLLSISVESDDPGVIREAIDTFAGLMPKPSEVAQLSELRLVGEDTGQRPVPPRSPEDQRSLVDQVADLAAQLEAKTAELEAETAEDDGLKARPTKNRRIRGGPPKLSPNGKRLGRPPKNKASE